MATTFTAATANASSALEDEIRRLEQELERKKLEDQIKQLEKQLQTVQKQQEEEQPNSSAVSVNVSASNHSSTASMGSSSSAVSVASSSNLSRGASCLHSLNSFDSSVGDDYYDEDDYEIVEIIEGSDGEEYEEIIEEYVIEEEEELSVSVDQRSNIRSMDSIEEVTECEAESSRGAEEAAGIERVQVPTSMLAPLRREQENDRGESAAVVPTSPVCAPPKPPAKVVGSVTMPAKKKRPTAKSKPATAAASAPSTIKTTGQPITPDAAPAKRNGFFRRLKKTANANTGKNTMPSTVPPKVVGGACDAAAAPKKMVRKVRVIRKRPAGKSSVSGAPKATTTGTATTPTPNSSPAVHAHQKKTAPAKPFQPRVIPNLPASAVGKEIPLELMVGPKLLTCANSKTKVSTVAAVKNQDLVLLYFGASWQKDCKRFTALLIDFYKACHASSTVQIEAIYVSSDRTLTEFKDCIDRLPFLAIPSGTSDAKNALTRQLKVIQQPTLVVLECKTGHVVTTQGVADIQALNVADAAAAVALGKKWQQTKAVPADQVPVVQSSDMEKGFLYWQTS